jgi:hypothetical protein
MAANYRLNISIIWGVLLMVGCQKESVQRNYNRLNLYVYQNGGTLDLQVLEDETILTGNYGGFSRINKEGLVFFSKTYRDAALFKVFELADHFYALVRIQDGQDQILRLMVYDIFGGEVQAVTLPFRAQLIEAGHASYWNSQIRIMGIGSDADPSNKKVVEAVVHLDGSLESSQTLEFQPVYPIYVKEINWREDEERALLVGSRITSNGNTRHAPPLSVGLEKEELEFGLQGYESLTNLIIDEESGRVVILGSGQTIGWMVMLDQELQELWSFSYGSSGKKHWLYDGIFTSEGFAAVGFAGNPQGGEDGLFIGLNNSGHLVSEHRYNAAEYERIFAIVPFKSNAFLLGGWVHYPTENRFDARIFETDLNGSFY